MRALILLLAAALAVAAASAARATPTATKLVGTVGPSFTISLKDGSGKTVKKLHPGAYKIVINDKSDFHNFHLTGPAGLSKSTAVPFQGTKTWSLVLEKGKYHYQCDPHSSTMNGKFTVG
jgi:plastocyanin